MLQTLKKLSGLLLAQRRLIYVVIRSSSNDDFKHFLAAFRNSSHREGVISTHLEIPIYRFDGNVEDGVTTHITKTDRASIILKADKF